MAAAQNTMTPTEARHFLETCNDEIEAGMTDDLARRIIAARDILAADFEAKRKAPPAPFRAGLARKRAA